MDKPKVAATEPKAVELEEGKKYAFCTCGLSDNQPFCNGAHKGTDFTPMVFTAEETKNGTFVSVQANQQRSVLRRFAF